MKLLTLLVFCLLLFRPAVVVNSQVTDKVVLDVLREKEAENRMLRVRVKENEKEINKLLSTLVGKKKVKQRPIHKRIFKKKNKSVVIKQEIPAARIDTSIETQEPIDTTPSIPKMIKKERFFKRFFKIFKRKS